MMGDLIESSDLNNFFSGQCKRHNITTAVLKKSFGHKNIATINRWKLGISIIPVKQRQKLATLFKLNPHEKKRFFDLVKRVERKIKNAQRESKRSLNDWSCLGEKVDSYESDPNFYGDWSNLAICTAVKDGTLNTEKKIMKALGLPEYKIKARLLYLKSIGAIVEKNKKLYGGAHEEISRNNAVLREYLHSARQETHLRPVPSPSDSTQQKSSYTICMSKEAAKKCMDVVKASIEKMHAIVEQESKKNEKTTFDQMYLFNIDFLNLKKVRER